MRLVKKVIWDRLHGVSRTGAFSYDDLFQISGIGLVKAAATNQGGCFSTYADRLIWNEICKTLVKATRLGEHESAVEPEKLTHLAQIEVDEAIEGFFCSSFWHSWRRRHPRALQEESTVFFSLKMGLAQRK